MKCLSLLKSYIPSSWRVICSLCRAVNADEFITADRYVISFTKFIANTTPIVELDCSENQVSTWGFQSCLNPASNLKPIMNNFKLPPPSQYIDPKSPLVLSIIHSSAMSAVDRMNSSNCMLDPACPAIKPSPLENTNSVLVDGLVLLVLTRHFLLFVDYLTVNLSNVIRFHKRKF